MKAKNVLVGDGGDYEALYVDGKKVWEGSTEDSDSDMAELYGVHGDIKSCDIGTNDVNILLNTLQFPETLDGFTDTEIPEE